MDPFWDVQAYYSMDAEGFFPPESKRVGLEAEYLFGFKVMNEWSRTSILFYAHDVPRDYLKLYLWVATFDPMHACAEEVILHVT